MEKENTRKVRILDKFFDEERKKRIVPVLLISFGLSFMLFIASPFEIFCNNIDQFIVTVNDIIGFLILYFFSGFIFLAALLMVLPAKVYKPFYAFFIAFFLLIYLQSNFLDFSVHTAADDATSSSLQGWHIAIDVIVWAVIFAAVFLLTYLIKNKGAVWFGCVILSVALIATQLVSVMVSVINTKDLGKPKDNVTALTTKGLNDISLEKNVFVFCVDRFDGAKYAEPCLKEHPEYFENLTGFTYYSEAISVYGHTYPGAVNILTGLRNDDGMDRLTYFDYAYNNNRTLKALSENNFEVNLFTDQYYTYDYSGSLPGYVTNSFKGRVKVKEKKPGAVAGTFVLMALYRAAPVFMSSNISWISSWTIDSYTDISFEGTDEGCYSTDMKGVNDYIGDKGFNMVADKNVFSFIHLSGCHSVAYDENWGSAGGKNLGINVSIKNSFSIIDKYIAEMKKSGVYEQATIIILGDHPDQYDNNSDVGEPRVTAMFVKPSGKAEGALEFSKAQVSHDDIWATIFKSAGVSSDWNTGEVIYEVDENADRARTFIWNYNYYIGDWKQSVWEVSGSAKDMKNWKLVKENVYKSNLYD